MMSHKLFNISSVLGAMSIIVIDIKFLIITDLNVYFYIVGYILYGVYTSKYNNIHKFIM